MEKNRIGAFLKVLIILFLSVVLICLIGRDHFVFGTALIILRWVFFAFGSFLLYRTTRRLTLKYFQILLSIALVIILMEYGWNKINEQTLSKSQTKTEVSLMTYNLFFKNRSPASSIKKIKECNPDILVVQELTPGLKNHLDKAIGGAYPYKKTLALNGTHGIGVYSKHRILKSLLLKNDNKLPFAQLVEIEIQSNKIQLVNAHLASPAIAVENPENFFPLLASNYELRESQLRKIQSVITKKEFDAQILMGDLNTTRYEPIFRRLKNNWIDLFDEAGIGSRVNFPNSAKTDPLLTLDYILVRGRLKGIKAKVIEGGSSDHLAIAGKIEI